MYVDHGIDAGPKGFKIPESIKSSDLEVDVPKKVEKIKVEKSSGEKSNKFWVGWDNLQKYNFILFIVHIILTFVLLFYFNKIKNPEKPVDFVNLDLYTEELVNAIQNDPSSIFTVVAKKAASINEDQVTSLIVAFFALTAFSHLIYSLNPGGIYLKAVKNGNNYLRWIEYSLSATIMIVVIALLSGVKNVNAYFILITSSIGMILTGQMFETSKGANRWIPILIGFILLIGIWVVIIKAFNENINVAKSMGKEIPTWLFLVVYVLFFFYSLFGFVPIAQIVFGGNYRRYEYFYLTLSLVSKVTLGLLVAIGFGQRSSASTPS